MDNPQKLSTLGTQNTRRRQTKPKTQHNIDMNSNISRMFTAV
jgi:hypothetical protein